MDLGLKDKKALVMASSQGLGKAIAEQFVREGTDVMIASRSEDQLKQVANELNRLQGGKVEYIRCDITNPDDIRRTVKHTVDVFGRIDILINNAGGPPAGSFEDLNDQDWQRSFELNLLSYIRVIREALPFLKEKGGRIINIASSSIREPIPGLILSNTFRLGIVGLSKTIADEFAKYNILVNTVGPGRIATERVEHLDEAHAQREGVSVDEIKARSKKDIPLGRDGKPEEFAKVVVFLASEGNTYMTGSTFVVDGGKLRSI
ncbi:SDR family oxidoreductase [Siminovitchia fortis]|uniref:SDR family oxidoreductase n=1 Tax=Siminovitchia fortis TaxID=254758 RepID=A0A451GBN7_9BACI|nr:SDR family oxidoreductase [Siminovitchia fortis]RWR12430.1 SDR family oxidoreductase [Siminovitchia fortis]WHY83477.1 SDR family oxidoreductase [Siminovitchia fortis]